MPNIRGCSVNGSLEHGAMCAHSLSEGFEEMTPLEFINFLEPNPNENRGGPICISSEDFMKLKNTIEKACKKLGNSCRYETKHTIKIIKQFLDVNRNISNN